ncbi:helix-turn-helix domain-containing protein [Cognatiluteimonas telluris]|uniref:helix-turn-helix domain-containing protein n=1 Tax=Cognatiluteimonas telluris TaxID=1104775 RepID=UPI00140A2ACE|nr:helix-turn-helix transcriptional regulator [Lysobacter telluris]
MKLVITRQWLANKLAHCDDAYAGAGGTSLADLDKEVSQRAVTPAVLSEVPTDLGKVVRYVRESRGWTRSDIANLANIDEFEVTNIETSPDYDPPPRTVAMLADVCHFSRSKFISLAQHKSDLNPSHGTGMRFAANSRRVDVGTVSEFDVVRALVAALSEDR